MTTEVQASPLAVLEQLSETSLNLPPNMPYEEWLRVGETLFRIEKSVRWWIGDWVNYGEQTYGEKYAQAITETGLSYSTVANAAYTARKIEPSRRREKVDFSKHHAVAGLDEYQQEKILGEIEAHPTPESKVREMVREEREKGAEVVEVTRVCPTCGGAGEVPVD